ncbi:protein tyrosine phosphatase [Falsochrobactrum shanghaiense]|uniref:Protein tyrosine phosphatase n=2 Tax=Falsochrobactrum shanghaiense TaxID=2201899 RepID=A0A316JBN2_9HYPH|nr:protein tyrosine phosphatase [Falsochrobactrum shanghaiense]
MTFFQRHAKMAFSFGGVLALALLIAASVPGGYLVAMQYKGNIHAIIAGEAYRSNQLDPVRITYMHNQHGIRSIINLRGAEPGSEWYDDEIATAKALGIQHIDFEMSASKQLSPERTQQLIAVMRNAQKPVLIHCKSGSDRTGLAAALYVAAIGRGSERRAERQLSIAYGHFGLPFSPTYAMERTFESVEAELGYPDS